MELIIVSGFVVFLPKYLETQFSLGKSQASVFTGELFNSCKNENLISETNRFHCNTRSLYRNFYGRFNPQKNGT